MTPRVHNLDTDIFTVSNLFTAAECQQLIEQGEGMGFKAAPVATSSGLQMMTGIRNNDRAVFEDADFARSVWERVQAYVPPQMDGCRVRGLDSRFRFYRYDPGQRFKRHKDGRVQVANGDTSRLTFLIYLNDGYVGGETVFSDHTFENGQTDIHEIRVSGTQDMGLFFVHERKHEGAPIQSGRKYVLRTDVLYEGSPVLGVDA